MKNLNSSSAQLSSKARKTALWFLFGAALLGFVDATYLSAQHFLGAIPPCAIVSGCETVLTSPYATPFLGIPLALLGAIYYLIVFLLIIFYRETESELFLKIIFFLTTLGFLTTVFLIYLQVFIIKAMCLYCIFSAITSTTLFISSIVLLMNIKGFKLKLTN